MFKQRHNTKSTDSQFYLMQIREQSLIHPIQLVQQSFQNSFKKTSKWMFI